MDGRIGNPRLPSSCGHTNSTTIYRSIPFVKNPETSWKASAPHLSMRQAVSQPAGTSPPPPQHHIIRRKPVVPGRRKERMDSISKVLTLWGADWGTVLFFLSLSTDKKCLRLGEQRQWFGAACAYRPSTFPRLSTEQVGRKAKSWLLLNE